VSSRNQPAVTGSNGVIVGSVIDGIHVVAGASIVQQSLPIDPQGFVYDSGTRQPVAGAAVSLSANGALVPGACLSGGANPAITSGSGGFAGGYQFLVDFTGAGCASLSGATFTISVTAPGMRFPSQLIAPGSSSGTTFRAPAGSGIAPIVSKAGIPGPSDPTTYYLAIVLASGSMAVVNNNIPLDTGNQGRLALTKIAGRSTAEIGDTVRYTLSVRNTGNAPLPGILIADRLPLGFKLVPGSVTLAGAAPGVSPGVTGAGPDLTIALPALAAGTSVTVQYIARVGVGADHGDGINRAVASSGAIRSNEALARVAVSGGVFGSDACIAGKVFVDSDGDGLQSPGESGVAGARLWTETGLRIRADSQGRYAFCGVLPGSHVLRLDPESLPPGLAPQVASSRNLGDARSVLVDVKPGEIARADFPLGVLRQVDAKGAVPAGVTAPPVASAPTAISPTAAPSPGPRDMIAVGVVDGVLSASHLRAGAIQPASRSDGFEEEIRHWSRSLGGDGQASGRAALFLKGRIGGDALLTAAYDSDKDTRQKLAQTIDPNAVYPVYGDESVLGFDAQSGSRLYVRVDRDHTYLLYGDFNTAGTPAAGPTRPSPPAADRKAEAVVLGRYARTVTGLQGHWESAHGRADGFVVDDTLRSIVEEYPANGTSGPFAVRNNNAVQNSERVEILVRDRNQRGVILGATTLVRFVDYTFEPFSGRILLTQAVATLTPAGDPNSIRITYEVDEGGSPFFTWGLSGSVQVAPGIEIGGGDVEDRDPLAPYRLSSAHADLAVGEHARVRAEVAQTDSTRFVADGQSYAASNALAGGTSAAQTAGAARLEGEYRDGGIEGRAWMIKAEEGFDNSSAGVVPGRMDAGARGSRDLDERNRLYAEFTQTRDQVSQTGREQARAGVQHRIDDRLALDLSLREVHDNAGFPAEAIVGPNAAPPAAGGATTGGFFGSGTSNTVIDPLTGAPVNALAPSGAGGAPSPGRSLHATTARAEATWKPQDAIAVRGAVESSLADDARRAAELGVDWKTSEHERFYARAETQTGLASPTSLVPADHSNAFVAGMTRDAGDHTSTFSEYRLLQASQDNVPGSMGQLLANGLRDRERVTGDWRETTSLEAVKALSGSQREALAAAVTFENGVHAPWRAAARVEARRLYDDRTLPGDQTQTQWLSTLTLARGLGSDWTLLAKNYWMLQQNHDDAGGNRIGDARQERLLLGFAWRPLSDSRINGLARYEYRNVNDASQALGDHYRADIVAGAMDFHPARGWWLGGRIAGKHEIDRNLPPGQQSFDAWLLGARVTRDVTQRIDVGVLASTLRQDAGIASQSAWGAEAGYRLVTNVWVSAGYNWSGFTDRDLAASDYTQRGVYLRLRAKFDETSLR